MSVLLSILVPTTPDRDVCTSQIRNKILSNRTGWTTWTLGVAFPAFIVFQTEDIEYIECLDEKALSIGEKRELLYKMALGKYSWQIDSDDDISDNSIDLILSGIESCPDVITFQERCEINGSIFSSNHSLKYEDWGENQDGFDYVRTPFMKSVIRTDIARSVPIPHIRFGEDHEWARALKSHLRNEIHIDKELYIYQHNSKPEDHNERYGIIS